LYQLVHFCVKRHVRLKSGVAAVFLFFEIPDKVFFING